MQTNTQEQRKDDDCSICLLPLVTGKALFTTSCGHQFHFDCIKDLKDYAHLCPMCRDPIPQLDAMVKKDVRSKYKNFGRKIRSFQPSTESQVEDLIDEVALDSWLNKDPSTQGTKLSIFPTLELEEIEAKDRKSLLAMLSIQAPCYQNSNRSRAPLDLVCIQTITSTKPNCFVVFPFENIKRWQL
eukprot:TRINITY_DN172_c1_g1_i1.p1 TRINITY_DN172_c1_g1~~TRINITY_DN172_c1_g1_i1.p1  ORF type:complete len:185 (+),score=11.60 TRINITY_DN172_c1_g1_i1:85-639(+)